MVVQVLKIRAELDNVDTLEFPNDHEWCVDITIPQTGDVRKGVKFSIDDEQEVPNSRGTAHLILKLDKNFYATVSIVDMPKETRGTITSTDSEAPTYVPVVAFECRGCEIEKWNPTGFYKITTPNGQVFDEVDLSAGEWYDVESDTNMPVSVISVQSDLVVCKK
jgi:hypothetical protein